MAIICLVAPRLGFFGGVERHVFDLAFGLRRRGHRVLLVHEGKPHGREADRFAAGFDEVAPLRDGEVMLNGADVVYTHKVDHRLFQAHVRGRLVIAVHDHDFTCVRSHRYLPLSQEPCGRPPGVSCVAHGCILIRDRSSRIPVGLRSPFSLRSQTRRAAQDAQLITGSTYLKRTLEEAGVASSRVTVIHPVPPEESTPVRKAPAEHVVAFVGQVIRGKGPDLLIHAAAQLPKLRVVVAGDGSARWEIERLVVKLGLTKRVEMLGPIPPEAVVEIYDAARLVAVPSRWPEPFGMVGIEAMRRGRPVVAAWHGGIPEWLSQGRTGWGFCPGDVGSLANALRYGLEYGGYDQVCARAIKWAQGRFSYARMIEQVEGALLGDNACLRQDSDQLTQDSQISTHES